MSVKGPQIDTQHCRMEKTAALRRCPRVAFLLQALLWPLLSPQHDPATRSPCLLLAILSKSHCQPLKTAQKLTGLVRPRECLLPPHLLTVLVPPLQTEPAFPGGVQAEALFMVNSFGNVAALLTMGHLLHLPMKQVPLHTPEGERQLV